MRKRAYASGVQVLQPGQFFVRAQLDGRYAIHVTAGNQKDAVMATLPGADTPRDDEQLIVVLVAVAQNGGWQIDHTLFQGTNRWVLPLGLVFGIEARNYC